MPVRLLPEALRRTGRALRIVAQLPPRMAMLAPVSDGHFFSLKLISTTFFVSNMLMVFHEVLTPSWSALSW